MGKLPDTEIDAMSDGDFYHYMLDKDAYEWARQCNRKLGLNFNPDLLDSLAGWFANCAMAMVDRPNAGYIRARIDAEKAEDLRKPS